MPIKLAFVLASGVRGPRSSLANPPRPPPRYSVQEKRPVTSIRLTKSEFTEQSIGFPLKLLSSSPTVSRPCQYLHYCLLSLESFYVLTLRRYCPLSTRLHSSSLPPNRTSQESSGLLPATGWQAWRTTVLGMLGLREETTRVFYTVCGRCFLHGEPIREAKAPQNGQGYEEQRAFRKESGWRRWAWGLGDLGTVEGAREDGKNKRGAARSSPSLTKQGRSSKKKRETKKERSGRERVKSKGKEKY